MGAALYIALEKEIPDLDAIINGKMISKFEKQLANVTKRLGVRPLMEFFSTDIDEAEALLGEEWPESIFLPRNGFLRRKA